jgi:hypothetical protein
MVEALADVREATGEGIAHVGLSSGSMSSMPMSPGRPDSDRNTLRMPSTSNRGLLAQSPHLHAVFEFS